MALTLAEANQIVQGALDGARAMNIRISVAVCDAGGRLIAFNRMDGAIWGSVYGSQGKAIASAGFARPSGELAERAGSPIIQGIVAAEGGHMIPSQGAVPIIRNGVVEGACGVGGGTAQQDEDCARAGVVKLQPRPMPRRSEALDDDDLGVRARLPQLDHGRVFRVVVPGLRVLHRRELGHHHEAGERLLALEALHLAAAGDELSAVLRHERGRLGAVLGDPGRIAHLHSADHVRRH